MSVTLSAAPCPSGRGQAFLELLPGIDRVARSSCRGLDAEARDDAVAEAVANAFVTFVRLAGRGRAGAATAASLARFGVRAYFSGRRTGSPTRGGDVLSPGARRKRGLKVGRLDEMCGGWKEVLVEDRTAGPADLAASRIDFPAWLRTLPERDRRLAERLAAGESPATVARALGLSPGRVSQLRRELADRWRAFHGEPGRRPHCEPAVAGAPA